MLFALITMLSWGTADIFAKKAIEKTGEFRALFFNQLLGVAPVFLYALLFMKIPPIPPESFALVFFAGLSVIVFYFTFYVAMKKGNLSLVNPIVGSYPAITTILGIIILNESLGEIQILAVLAIFLGIILMNVDLKKIKFSLAGGVKEAILTMFGWGFAFFLVRMMSVSIGVIATLLYLRVVALGLLLIYGKLRKTSFRIEGGRIWHYVLVAGLLDAAGQLAYSTAVINEQLSIVSPITAAFPAVTVVLAILFLRERPVFNQKIGIASILAGLVLISAA